MSRTNVLIFSSKAKKAKTLGQIVLSVPPEEQELYNLLRLALFTESKKVLLPSEYKDVLEDCVRAGAKLRVVKS